MLCFLVGKERTAKLICPCAAHSFHLMIHFFHLFWSRMATSGFFPFLTSVVNITHLFLSGYKIASGFADVTSKAPFSLSGPPRFAVARSVLLGGHH